MATPSSQMGICRSTSGLVLAGCSTGISSRKRNFGFIDLIEKQEMGDAAILELFEDDLQRRDPLGVGLADDDGRIAGR